MSLLSLRTQSLCPSEKGHLPSSLHAKRGNTRTKLIRQKFNCNSKNVARRMWNTPHIWLNAYSASRRRSNVGVTSPLGFVVRSDWGNGQEAGSTGWAGQSVCLGVGHCSSGLSDLCNMGITSMAPDIYLAFNNGNYYQYSKNNQRCLQTGLRDTRFPWWLSGKASACNAGDQVRSLGREDPPEKGRATRSSILACRIPWTEEPGRLQSMGSQRVGHD